MSHHDSELSKSIANRFNDTRTEAMKLRFLMYQNIADEIVQLSQENPGRPSLLESYFDFIENDEATRHFLSNIQNKTDETYSELEDRFKGEIQQYLAEEGVHHISVDALIRYASRLSGVLKNYLMQAAELNSELAFQAKSALRKIPDSENKQTMTNNQLTDRTLHRMLNEVDQKIQFLKDSERYQASLPWHSNRSVINDELKQLNKQRRILLYEFDKRGLPTSNHEAYPATVKTDDLNNTHVIREAEATQMGMNFESDKPPARTTEELMQNKDDLITTHIDAVIEVLEKLVKRSKTASYSGIIEDRRKAQGLLNAVKQERNNPDYSVPTVKQLMSVVTLLAKKFMAHQDDRLIARANRPKESEAGRAEKRKQAEALVEKRKTERLEKLKTSGNLVNPFTSIVYYDKPGSDAHKNLAYVKKYGLLSPLREEIILGLLNQQRDELVSKGIYDTTQITAGKLIKLNAKPIETGLVERYLMDLKAIHRLDKRGNPATRAARLFNFQSRLFGTNKEQFETWLTQEQADQIIEYQHKQQSDGPRSIHQFMRKETGAKSVTKKTIAEFFQLSDNARKTPLKDIHKTIESALADKLPLQETSELAKAINAKLAELGYFLQADVDAVAPKDDLLAPTLTQSSAEPEDDEARLEQIQQDARTEPKHPKPLGTPGLSAEQEKEVLKVIYGTKTRRGIVGSMKSGVSKVNSHEDAAHIFSPLRKEGQERFLALVLDKNNRPIEIIDVSKGDHNSTSVNPLIVVPAICTVEGAESVWFAHNHPSGNPAPSHGDHIITDKLNEVLRPLNINIAGHVVIGTSSYSTLNDEEGPLRPSLRNQETIKLTTRRFTGQRNTMGPYIDSASKAIHLGNNVSKKVGSENHIILCDNRHAPVAYLGLNTHDTVKLLANDAAIAKRVIQAVETSGAAAAIVSTDEEARGKNVATLLHTINVRVLDLICKGESFVEKQLPLFRHSKTYCRLNGQPSKHPGAVRSALNALKRESAQPDRIQIIDSILQLPSYLQHQLYASEQNNIFTGVYDDVSGQVYLNTGNIHSVDDAVKTYTHEVISHLGLRSMLGPKRHQQLMQDVYRSMPSSEIKRIHSQYGELPKLDVADEYVAELSETHKNPSIIKQVVASVRSLIRKVVPGISMSSNDIEFVLTKVKQHMKFKGKAVEPTKYINPQSLAKRMTRRLRL